MGIYEQLKQEETMQKRIDELENAIKGALKSLENYNTGLLPCIKANLLSALQED